MDFKDYVQQGYKYFQDGIMDKALENFEAALKLQPDSNETKQLIENTRMRMEFELKKTQALFNEIKHRLGFIGITNIDNTEISDVEKVISVSIDSYKNNPNDETVIMQLSDAYYIHGLMCMLKKDNINAIKDFSEAFRINPDFVLALNKRATLNREMKNFEQAINDYKEVITLNPDNDQTKVNLASVYMQRGVSFFDKKEYTYAISDFEIALKYNPDNKNTIEFLAMAKTEMVK